MSVARTRSGLASVSPVLNFLYQVRSLRAFFAEMQSEEYLFEHMHGQLERLERRMVARLDNNPLKSPTRWERSRIESARLLKREVLAGWSRAPETPLVEAYLARVRERTLNARKTEQVSRLVWALNEAVCEGWYPVFVTLTVKPEKYDAVFSKESSAWKNYHRAVRRAIGRRLGLSKRESEAADIHRFMAVVERGHLRGRLHIHVVHLCKALPVEAIDPNRGRATPDYREMKAWCQFWEFGFVSAIPIRLAPMDVYARQGWKWPVVRKGDRWEPYRSAGVLGVARYVGKYLAKTRYDDKEYWRCRMSRNLGLEKISRTISKFPMKRLLRISRGHLPRVKLETRAIPKHLMRRAALREMMRRNPERMIRMYSRLVPVPSLVQRARTGFTWIPSLRNMGDFSWLVAAFETEPPGRPISGLVGPTT